MRRENKLFNFIMLQSLVMERGATRNRLNAMPCKDRSQNTREFRGYVSRKADANISSSFELFHGQGDRLVVSAGRRIKGKYRWQPEKKKGLKTKE